MPIPLRRFMHYRSAVSWSLLCLMTCAAGSWSARAQNGNLQFSASAYLAKESAGAAKITVKRTGGSSGTISVNFSTLDDAGSGTSAIAGLDYYPTNGTLTFEPGVTTRIFYVPLINDMAHEGNETVVLALSDVSEGGTLGSPDNATLTITDNDVCSYAVDPPTRTANEVGGLAAFHVVAPDGCD
ncbi:MAG TPA: Calx-beta domain-containing protein, partial [Candidatus Saccharimonadales bacterium]|nr:Calx-beta domain-containing protein [Candidatus Saccharimonadales bacterium]